MLEMLDTSLVSEFLKWGGFALILGVVTIVSFELLIFGIMKTINFFRL